MNEKESSNIVNAKEEISPNIPNDETMSAMKELEEGRGTRCKNIEGFWNQMRIDPNKDAKEE